MKWLKTIFKKVNASPIYRILNSDYILDFTVFFRVNKNLVDDYYIIPSLCFFNWNNKAFHYGCMPYKKMLSIRIVWLKWNLSLTPNLTKVAGEYYWKGWDNEDDEYYDVEDDLSGGWY